LYHDDRHREKCARSRPRWVRIPESVPCSGVSDGVTDSSAAEAPAAKLWAVYVSEAEKYDRSLVESWKSDMEGMLIFVRL
jgi:hypothetical protein